LVPQVSGTNGTAVNLTWGGAAQTDTDNITVGRVSYNLKVENSTGYTTLTFRLKDLVQPGVSDNPAVLFIENEDDDNNFEAIIIPTGNSAEGKIQADASNIAFTSAGTNVGTFETTEDSDVARAVDEWGTLVERNTDNEDLATIWYPREQAVADVALGPDPVFGGGAGTGGTVQAAVKIQNPVAKLASEVPATSALPMDLILVGGPCANSVVASLLQGGAAADQCATWDHNTGIIRVVNNAFGSGKKALIVAGTDATDTRGLAARVMRGELSFSD
ncbi:MAG: S-layer protein, partial [Candidatus Aenigmarchaeota archaeon]|nr:S-layer protein [Candidatus Aenigmarchaeota archaeon]